MSEVAVNGIDFLNIFKNVLPGSFRLQVSLISNIFLSAGHSDPA